MAAAAFGTVAAGSTAFAAGTDSGNASKPPSCNMKHTQADGKSGTVVARAVAGSTGETPAHKAGDKVERKLVASDGKVAGKVTTADGKTEVKTITLDGKADVSCASIELTEAKPAQKKAG
ncbi:hypothetical protein [Streptomyces sp. NPDC002537]